MTCRRSLAVIAVAILGAAATFACGRSPFPGCPGGYALDESGECICTSDAVCPTDYACIEGLCQCNSSACCPGGFTFTRSATVAHPPPPEDASIDGGAQDGAPLDAGRSDGGRRRDGGGDAGPLDSGALDGASDGGARTSTSGGYCFCKSDACCPSGTRFDGRGCTCADSSCCPAGHTFDPSTAACICTSDHCCPDGYAFDSATGRCTCTADACCPFHYRWDDMQKGCTCAADECCPEQHRYNPTAQACVCTGTGCCPDGFHPTMEGGCACARDDACPMGLHCDLGSGRCVCTVDTDCGSGSFCNRIGFCQSLNACGGNSDCPSGTFCDIDSNQCLSSGVCARDAHCPVGQICDAGSGRCTAGCRSTADCKLLDVCLDGRCLSNRCETNGYCGAREFCDTSTHLCGLPDQNYCAPCGMDCTGTCLQPIVEGDPSALFCGIPCMTDSDCPGATKCDDSYSQCFQGSGECEMLGLICLETVVLNQMGTSFFCSDPNTMDPSPTGHFCAPREAHCPP
jgi:hypothetical protein